MRHSLPLISCLALALLATGAPAGEIPANTWTPAAPKLAPVD